ncbi:MAG: DNA polymerase III subunit gamma/tau [Ferrovum sp.]|nr:DNA polymerase III subunit gamma/tau [Ferrovum sp.]
MALSTHVALARKWRPKNFTEMVGQTAVVQALQNALNTGRLHHAYLLTGTRGVGKTTLARILAKSVNCEMGMSANPCGVCSNCQAIDQGVFPDLIEVDAATNTKVDEMRELLETAHYHPAIGRYKVYLIDEVHMLSRHSFNAMLKTLEEPPGYILFVLATTDPQKIPITILSRCLQFNLRPLSIPQIEEQLMRVLQAEDIEFEAPALTALAQAGQGSMRDALTLLDQAIAYGQGKVIRQEVENMLGLSNRQQILDILKGLGDDNGEGLMKTCREMIRQGNSLDHALQELGQCFLELAMIEALPQSGDLPPDLEAFRSQWKAQDLQLFYQIVTQSRQDLPLAPDEASGFRMSLLRLLAFRPEYHSDQERVRTPTQKIPSSEKSIPLVLATPAIRTQSITLGMPQSHDEWLALVAQLSVGGMQKELLVRLEWVKSEGNLLMCHLDPENGHLKSFNNGVLTKALQSVLGESVRLNIQVGERTQKNFLEQKQEQDNQQKQQDIALFEQDTVVQMIQNQAQGKIDKESIRRH